MHEIAILVGVSLDKSTSLDYELKELESLCEACEIEVVDKVTQNLSVINTATYIGKGKVSELRELISYHNADCVVFNDELTPSQISNLESVLDCAIYDRTYVILEIFKRRNSTKEAYLQVEIARLEYFLPRLSGLRKGLSRIGGGGKTRGSGETQLELDRRHITNKIVALKSELEEAKKVRSTQRERRDKNKMKVVSLVGYTNSGKSSTLNAILKYSVLPKKEVMEKDMLFATLETSTRGIKLKNNHHFLLTDTVGFVEKLPHHLVEAFKSTLEEITESDLILHVVDASNPEFIRQIKTTNEVLSSIGVNDIKTIYLFNKIDKVDDYLYIPEEYPNSIRISAKEDINLELLLSKIEKEIFEDTYIKILLPFSRGDILSELKENYNVTKFDYTLDGIIVEAYVDSKMRNILSTYII